MAHRASGLLTCVVSGPFCVLREKSLYYTHYYIFLYTRIFRHFLKRLYYTHYCQFLYMRILRQKWQTPHYTHFLNFLYTRILRQNQDFLLGFFKRPHYTHFLNFLYMRIFPSAQKKFAAVGLNRRRAMAKEPMRQERAFVQMHKREGFAAKEPMGHVPHPFAAWKACGEFFLLLSATLARAPMEVSGEVSGAGHGPMGRRPMENLPIGPRA